MKATKLLLIVLSCMLVIGCKKNKSDDEPTPPTPQTDTISAQVLQSYYPYKNMEQIKFASTFDYEIVSYSVINSKLSYKDKQMSLSTTMSGKGLGDSTPLYHLSLSADVTNGTVLKIDFRYLEGISEMKASYTHDITKDGKLPETIEFSSEKIKVTLKKDKGLTEYLDITRNNKWWLYEH